MSDKEKAALAFIREKGLLGEYRAKSKTRRAKINRKDKARLERRLSDGEKLVVYVKDDHLVIRNVAARAPFEDSAFAKKAGEKGLEARGRTPALNGVAQ